MSDAPLLELSNLKTHFKTEDGPVKAVDGISVQIREGEVLGLVGESGSGKSVTSLTIMQLLPPGSAELQGTVSFLGRNLLELGQKQIAEVRGRDIAMIFQEPMTALNPVHRVGDQVIEAIRTHQKASKVEAKQRAIDLFREVGIPEPETRIFAYPHEMSGGQKQRVMIAMALACNPKLLICDEPTTALDVTIQAQILDLLRALRDSRGMAMLFITHDLGVIAEIADRVAVMYRGHVVEYGDVLQVYANPQHPYTRGLLACRPRLDTPYTLLPTVDDFMDVRVEGDTTVIVPREVDTARLEALTHGGRKKRHDTQGDPLLSVRDLSVHFRVRGFGSKVIKAVDGVSFDVFPGQTLGLVGESGCGKTTTGRAILHLIDPNAGEIRFDGKDLGGALRYENVRASRAATLFGLTALFGLFGAIGFGFWITGLGGGGALALFAFGGAIAAACGLAGGALQNYNAGRSLRADVQIVFQDPYSSLNPRQTVEQILTEPMYVHGIGSSEADRQKRAADLLVEVGLKPEHLRRYPHEFSGGQRQRICIARALSVEPRLVICDEAVSALDVSVQAQVLNLLKSLQERRNLTYIFISHDLAVVKFMSDQMAVMQAGRIVEMGDADAIYANPAQNYTKNLIDAIPKDDIEHIKAVRAKSGRYLAPLLDPDAETPRPAQPRKSPVKSVEELIDGPIHPVRSATPDPEPVHARKTEPFADDMDDAEEAEAASFDVTFLALGVAKDGSPSVEVARHIVRGLDASAGERFFGYVALGTIPIDEFTELIAQFELSDEQRGQLAEFHGQIGPKGKFVAVEIEAR